MTGESTTTLLRPIRRLCGHSADHRTHPEREQFGRHSELPEGGSQLPRHDGHRQSRPGPGQDPPAAHTRFGERAVLLAGLAMLLGAMGWLARLPVQADYVTDLLPVMLLIAGGGLVLPALTSLGMSGAKADDAGLASGLFNTTQQIGMAFGVAVLSTLAATRTENLLSEGRDAATALTGGYQVAFMIAAALLVAAFTVALTVLRQPARLAPAGAAPVSG
ncbi:hypothetical protein ACIBG7_33940 [Nonomuraea sp. NPDC050328]|uniref:hypothetical protein n=1 Tax=Nonomuraea sp. NPDC050328 TaxID=3364361 RepID=UPI0037A6F173